MDDALESDISNECRSICLSGLFLKPNYWANRAKTIFADAWDLILFNINPSMDNWSNPLCFVDEITVEITVDEIHSKSATVQPMSFGNG